VLALAAAPVGRPITGPALVESADATVLVPPGWTATVAAGGAVLLDRIERTGTAAGRTGGAG
jgi:N-methylhydantoinase A/oxoprolinase/acetone carboxylase beta subunit